MMKMNDYYAQAIGFALYPEEHRVVYPALGLAGEAGEVTEKIKKLLRDHGTVDAASAEYRREIAKELGDVLWYIANLAGDLGFSLDEIAEMNIRKLSDRRDRNVLRGSGDNR